MSLARVLMVAGALAVLLQAGCAEKAMRPTVTEVDLSLAVSPATGNPSQPVVADVRVRNVGNTRVWHSDGCGCDAIAFTVLGPDGAVVLLRDPNAIGPLCPCWTTPLEPGLGLSGGLLFNGTLYVKGYSGFPTPTYPAPAGTYTVLATFGYQTSVPGEPFTVERKTTFTWVP